MKELFVLLVVVCFFILQSGATTEFTLPLLTSRVEPTATSSLGVDTNSASRIAADAINAGLFPGLLPHTKLNLLIRDDFGSYANSIKLVIETAEEGYTFATGFGSSTIAAASGIAGSVYGMAQFSATAATAVLSDKLVYPYFCRLSPSTHGYTAALRASILHYSQYGKGWTDVAIIASSAEFSISLAEAFIGDATGISVVSYQQFLLGDTEFQIQLREIQDSGARVIIAFVSGREWPDLLAQANEVGIVGDHYVWFVPSTVVGTVFDSLELSRGAIGSFLFVPTESPELDLFNELWYSADPDVYPLAGGVPTTFTYLGFDRIIAAAHAIDSVERMGLLDDYVSPETWANALRNVSYDAVSGPISFDENCDRVGIFELVYYSPEDDSWLLSARWSEEDGYTMIDDVVWFSNSTEIPDLDIRNSFDYWSCDDGKKKHDETGKTIVLHTPDRNEVDDIDEDYHCDAFLDCWNLSDESVDCSYNYKILFISFGIVTIILILVAIILIFFVVLFGLILGYRRLRVASPVFLIIVLLSIVMGYSSIFAWFGKPHPVACAFQPWLLGLSTISMIAALSAKNFRIWRIFKFPLARVHISNFELVLLWAVMVIPSVVILIVWSIVSTPTAKMEERDGMDHYICTTGGFTGEPGGIIFFFIFVGYSTIVLAIGGFLSIVTRKVPTLFNESKLLTISIYNLGFLAVVIIPVFLVVNPFNPFIAWILRTVAILYAFTATMAIQFLPILWGIIITDKGKNVKIFKSKLNKPGTISSSKESQIKGPE